MTPSKDTISENAESTRSMMALEGINISSEEAISLEEAYLADPNTPAARAAAVQTLDQALAEDAAS